MILTLLAETYRSFSRPSNVLAQGSFSKSILSWLSGLGFALVLFSIFRGPLILWGQNGTVVVPAGSFLLLGGVLLILGTSVVGRKDFVLTDFLNLKVGSIGLLLVFWSDWLSFRFNLFQGPSIRGELILAFGGAVFLLFFRLGRKLLPLLVLSFPCLLFLVYFQEANGRSLFSDDHTAVFYRLALLKENFPHIPFYNPLWNGGIDARDFFATGILNFYFLFYPVLALLGPDESYAFLVGVVVFLFLPASTYAASRLHGLSRSEACLAVGLSIASSLLWYRWCLKYGAMGFVVSTAILPLNLAFVARLFQRKSLLAWEWGAFLLTLSLMFFWTLSLLVFLPLGIYALVSQREIFFSRRFQGFLLAFLLLNVPWVLVFLDSSKVLEFLKVKAPTLEEQAEDAQDRERADSLPVGKSSSEKIHSSAAVQGRAHSISGKAVTKSIRNFATNSNPLLLFLAIPGILLLPRKESRSTFGITAGWLLFLGAVCAPTLPQLELERMLVILGVVLAVPVGGALMRLLQDAEHGGASKILLAAVPFSFVLVSGPSVSSVIRNRSLEHYAWADGTVQEMIDTIREFGGNGRVVFSGFVLHELSQGHLAPLAYWTNHPLVASSPFHNRWVYTNVIPEGFMDGGAEGPERYFDIMNTTAVLAHEREWRQYFAARPDRYQYIRNVGRFQFFTRKGPSDGYFLKGKGEILEQNSHQIRLRVDESDAVIKFSFFPFLTASGCALSSEKVAPEVEFIHLRECTPGATVTIESVNAFQRLRN